MPSTSSPNPDKPNQNPWKVDEKPYSLRSNNKPRDLSKVICYKCQKPGHYANICPEGKSNPNTQPLGKGKETAILSSNTAMHPKEPQLELQSRKHLSVETAIYMPNKSERTTKALVDSGATFNFISQFMVKKMGLPSADNLLPPSICQIGGKPLRTYRVHSISLLVNNDGKLCNYTGMFVAADLTTYDMILGLPWLESDLSTMPWPKPAPKRALDPAATLCAISPTC